MTKISISGSVVLKSLMLIGLWKPLFRKTQRRIFVQGFLALQCSAQKWWWWWVISNRVQPSQVQRTHRCEKKVCAKLRSWSCDETRTSRQEHGHSWWWCVWGDGVLWGGGEAQQTPHRVWYFWCRHQKHQADSESDHICLNSNSRQNTTDHMQEQISTNRYRTKKHRQPFRYRLPDSVHLLYFERHFFFFFLHQPKKKVCPVISVCRKNSKVENNERCTSLFQCEQ